MDNQIIDSTIVFADTLSQEIKKLKGKLPYHLNLIDELRANENAHNRVLAKILQYSENNSFPFLQLFFNHLDFELIPEKPIITVEKERIDILITDNNYSIIIENKINYATDQESQVINYVEKIKKKSKIENIYVLYLTRQGIKKPNESSIPQKLKEKLGRKYKEINFRQNILPWLEELLPLCRIKDLIFVSAINQYIDFLKGIFSIRENQHTMNEELENIIKSKLGLNKKINSIDDNIIVEKLNQLVEINNTLQSMHIKFRNDIRKSIFKKLFFKLNQESSSWICKKAVFKNATIEEINAKNFGFAHERHVTITNKDVFLSIEINNWHNFLCGVFINNNNDLKEKIIEIFERQEIKIQSTNSWVYLDLDEYDFNGNKIAYNVYDDKWNELFEKEIDGIVDTFFNQIRRVLSAWIKVE